MLRVSVGQVQPFRPGGLSFWGRRGGPGARVSFRLSPVVRGHGVLGTMAAHSLILGWGRGRYEEERAVLLCRFLLLSMIYSRDSIDYFFWPNCEAGGI